MWSIVSYIKNGSLCVGIGVNMQVEHNFSIFDTDNSLELVVFTEYNTRTNKYEVIFSHCVDLFTGLPIALNKFIYHKEEINLKLNELNFK